MERGELKQGDLVRLDADEGLTLVVGHFLVAGVYPKDVRVGDVGVFLRRNVGVKDFRLCSYSTFYFPVIGVCHLEEQLQGHPRVELASIASLKGE